VSEIRVLVRGVDGVTAELARLEGAARSAFIQANNVKLEKVRSNAVRRAPKDTGELRRSAVVNRVNADGGGSVAFLAPHALPVHEMTWRQYRIGEAKFLENALKEEMKTWEAEVSAAVKRAVEARGGGG